MPIGSPVATPTFSPSAGTYNTIQTVTISDTDSGLTSFAMRYTTDGSTPTESHGTLIASGGTVSITTSSTLKAIAYAPDFTDSTVQSAGYTISLSPISNTIVLILLQSLNWLTHI
jgi:hypothetical protein